jgi:hypothetical protein
MAYISGISSEGHLTSEGGSVSIPKRSIDAIVNDLSTCTEDSIKNANSILARLLKTYPAQEKKLSGIQAVLESVSPGKSSRANILASIRQIRTM